MKAAICDDEPVFLNYFQDQLQLALNDCKMECSVSAYQLGFEMLKNVDKYDIIFLDVDMPYISGETVAAYIKESGIQPLIIFVTNHDDFVFSSFKYRPFGFIRKKYVDKELLPTIENIKDFFDKRDELFVCTSHGKKIYAKYSDIVYFESYSHEIIAHTIKEDFTFNEPLAKLEKRLEGRGFIRTHSSYLVNSIYIFSVERDRVIFSTKEHVPLSRKRVSDVKQKMITYLRR